MHFGVAGEHEIDRRIRQRRRFLRDAGDAQRVPGRSRSPWSGSISPWIAANRLDLAAAVAADHADARSRRAARGRRRKAAGVRRGGARNCGKRSWGHGIEAGRGFGASCPFMLYGTPGARPRPRHGSESPLHELPGQDLLSPADSRAAAGSRASAAARRTPGRSRPRPSSVAAPCRRASSSMSRSARRLRR